MQSSSLSNSDPPSDLLRTSSDLSLTALPFLTDTKSTSVGQLSDFAQAFSSSLLDLGKEETVLQGKLKEIQSQLDAASGRLEGVLRTTVRLATARERIAEMSKSIETQRVERDEIKLRVKGKRRMLSAAHRAAGDETELDLASTMADPEEEARLLEDATNKRLLGKISLMLTSPTDSLSDDERSRLEKLTEGFQVILRNYSSLRDYYDSTFANLDAEKVERQHKKKVQEVALIRAELEELKMHCGGQLQEAQSSSPSSENSHPGSTSASASANAISSISLNPRLPVCIREALQDWRQMESEKNAMSQQLRERRNETDELAISHERLTSELNEMKTALHARVFEVFDEVEALPATEGRREALHELAEKYSVALASIRVQRAEELMKRSKRAMRDGSSNAGTLMDGALSELQESFQCPHQNSRLIEDRISCAKKMGLSYRMSKKESRPDSNHSEEEDGEEGDLPLTGIGCILVADSHLLARSKSRRRVSFRSSVSEDVFRSLSNDPFHGKRIVYAGGLRFGARHGIGCNFNLEGPVECFGHFLMDRRNGYGVVLGRGMSVTSRGFFENGEMKTKDRLSTPKIPAVNLQKYLSIFPHVDVVGKQVQDCRLLVEVENFCAFFTLMGVFFLLKKPADKSGFRKVLGHLQGIAHPSILRFAGFSQDPCGFLTTEPLFAPISELLSQGEFLRVEDKLRILRLTAEAVVCFHLCTGCPHGDLSWGVVWATQPLSDPSWEIKLAYLTMLTPDTSRFLPSPSERVPSVAVDAFLFGEMIRSLFHVEFQDEGGDDELAWLAEIADGLLRPPSRRLKLAETYARLLAGPSEPSLDLSSGMIALARDEL